MAYRPSFRRTHEEGEAEPNLTPIMNLMVVLIPLLLTSAEYIKIGVIELNLPPAAGPAQVEQQKPREKTRTLDLTVSITDQGFYISSAIAVLRPGDGKGPSVPLKADGSYDFEKLSIMLLDVKRKAEGKFPDIESITIQAEPGVHYQTLVSTMDAARAVKVDGQLFVLFPQVSLSAGII